MPSPPRGCDISLFHKSNQQKQSPRIALIKKGLHGFFLIKKSPCNLLQKNPCNPWTPIPYLPIARLSDKVRTMNNVKTKPAASGPGKPSWSLPYETTMPSQATPSQLGRLTVARVAVYIALATALIVPVVQLQHKTLKNHRKAQAYHQKLAASDSGDPAEVQLPPRPPKAHAGAVNRWRKAVRAFWAGENIYETIDQLSQRHRRYRRMGKTIDYGKSVALHPNMPFTVMLLTPFALGPVWLGGLVFSILKVLVIVAAALGAVRVANHKNLRMPDWLVALAVAWWVQSAIGDIQHANTNIFVLGAIVLHLWLYRRGAQAAAGVALALAICIKMTPALFVLYWLYQRNWKLLLGCLAGLVLLAVVVPAGALGPGHYAELAETWLNNLIFKGVGGSWYPIHVNQSLPAVLGRYLLGGHEGGNIYWNADDNTYASQRQFHWIALVSLDPTLVKRLIQLAQGAVVLLMAWAIGWRKLARDDGRRGLHYAMVLLAILLLNQRTWDHHAAILLPATLAIWYAVAFGRVSRRVRIITLAMVILAGVAGLLGAGSALVSIGRACGLARADAKEFANVVGAYGLKFSGFLLMFLSAVILSLALKRPPETASEPYAKERQKLGK